MIGVPVKNPVTSKAWHSSPCPAMAASISGVSPSPLAAGITERSLAFLAVGNDGNMLGKCGQNMEKQGKTREKSQGKHHNNRFCVLNPVFDRFWRPGVFAKIGTLLILIHVDSSMSQVFQLWGVHRVAPRPAFGPATSAPRADCHVPPLCAMASALRIRLGNGDGGLLIL